MTRRCGNKFRPPYPFSAISIAVLLVIWLHPRPLAAEELSNVRVATQFGLAYLPLIVMEHDQLWEKQAKAHGVDVKVEYSQLGGGSTLNDALISDSAEVVAGGIPPLLALWDHTRSNFDVRGLSALNISPIFLLSNRAAAKTVKDFDANDRIAVPAVRSGSIQSILLAMAAEQAYGPGQYHHFDDIEVAMQHPDAFAALVSGGTPITAYFSSSPFQERALANPKIHKVTDSFQIQGGPATFSVAYAKAKFVENNPKLVAAYYDALNEAIAYIKLKPDAAIDDYIVETNDKTDRALLMTILKGSYEFDPTPKNSMPIAAFMAHAGMIKNTPTSWKDYFFKGVQSLNGS